MTEMGTKEDESVQFVFDNASFMLDPSGINSDGLSDIIYSAGSRAGLVNCQIMQDGSEIVGLEERENISQYYIKDENDEIVVTSDTNESNTRLDKSEIVHYIEENGNIIEEPQIVYITDEDLRYQIAESLEPVSSTLPLGTIKLEVQVVDLEKLMKQQVDQENILDNFCDLNGYQYAVLKNGKLHIQSYDSGESSILPNENQVQEEGQKEYVFNEHMDISAIKGTNLLTGQSVSLHIYMEKLKKKLNKSLCSISKDHQGFRKRTIELNSLKGLLNKKLALGKTTNGKRIIGKIIRVEKKPETSTNEKFGCSIEINNKSVKINESDKNVIEDGNDEMASLAIVSVNSDSLSGETSNKDNERKFVKTKKISHHPKIVSKECLEHISRTLEALISMERIRRKLRNKSLLITVVEKKYQPVKKLYRKSVSYGSGYMQEEFTYNEPGKIVGNWCFVPDLNITEVVFGQPYKNENEGISNCKFNEITHLTVVITYEKSNERLTRLILNPARSNEKCRKCSKEFQCLLDLEVHLLMVHDIVDNANICEICGLNFETMGMLKEHKKLHTDRNKLFRYMINGCEKYFSTAGKLKKHSTLKHFICCICSQRYCDESSLKKHLASHVNVEAFSCISCGESFANPADLNFHKRIHAQHKYYACDICKRTFSRHSNLQRHVEIHKGVGEIYMCTICGCSYHYMSSLTRHVVQNHV